MADIKEIKFKDDTNPGDYNRSLSDTPSTPKPIVVKQKLRPQLSRNIYVAQKKYYGPKATLQDVKDDFKM